MPSEQRLHPATLLFDLARHLKQFAVPALLVIFGMSRSSGGPGGMFGRLPSGWEVWLMILFVPATVVSIARYLSFRLRYADRELVIRSGLIFRNERHIPFSRIQNVDAIQNLFHRLLGVVEVRLETGGGKEEEARLSVLPLSALDELRTRVFGERPGAENAALETEHPSHPTHGTHPTHLLHLPPKELFLHGFLENKGLILIGAAYGVAWESGILGALSESFFETAGITGRGFFRSLAESVFDDAPLPVAPIVTVIAMLVGLLVFVRVVSIAWAFLRLYDFRLTRVGEDLRSEYGLFTKVTATIPIRRVQTITIRTGPLYRWLDRATVTVATAGGAGTESTKQGRERLAPLIHQRALPHLLQQVVPGFDPDRVNWQPVHPRAFARAVKPPLIVSVIFTAAAALFMGWGTAIGVAIVMLLWAILGTRIYVSRLGWAEDDEVVMMRSGWLWRQTTLARVNKIQAVAMRQSPFDRRAAMAAVSVDTAGAGEFSHRVAIPFLDYDVARGLAERLSACAANTAFRW